MGSGGGIGRNGDCICAFDNETALTVERIRILEPDEAAATVTGAVVAANVSSCCSDGDNGVIKCGNTRGSLSLQQR